MTGPDRIRSMQTGHSTAVLVTSASFLAEVSVRSAPKLFIFVIYKKIFSRSTYPKHILFDFEKGSTGC